MTVVNAREFEINLSAHVERLGERADQFVQGFCQTLFSEIHSGGRYSPGTPVDTGFARASWYAGVGGPGSARGLAEPTARSPGLLASEAAAALADLDEVSLHAKAGDVVELANDARYIGVLENGSSQQAPQGMVRLAILAGQQIADEVAAHVMGQRAA